MATNVTPGELPPKQRKAVEALITTGEVAAAAQAAGVARHTLYRWLKESVFLAAVRETEARALDELSRLLVRLGRTAAATLAKAKAMSDPAAPWSTRVRAADASLARLLQLRELAVLDARVTELERLLGWGRTGRPERLGEDRAAGGESAGSLGPGRPPRQGGAAGGRAGDDG